MNSLMFFLMAPSQNGGGSGSFFSTIIMFGVIIMIFYFMILRPQKKRQLERQKLLNSLKKGDKIVTSGGLHGTIAGLDEKTVLVQVSDNVKLKFERSSIGSVIREAESETK